MPTLQSLTLSNFKKFESLSFQKITPKHAIMGLNGSGKTTMIWSIILFCRGYNTLVKSSQHLKDGCVRINANEMALLCNYSALTGLDSFSHFIPSHQWDQTEVEHSISATINGEEYKCVLKMNGHFVITPSPNKPKNQKIRFAFMGTDSIWQHAQLEPAAGDILTSNMGNPRNRYYGLKKENQVRSRNFPF
jgi:predicted ATP-binding protein involved in virulence